MANSTFNGPVATDPQTGATLVVAVAASGAPYVFNGPVATDSTTGALLVTGISGVSGTIPIATTSTLGGVIAGSNVNITAAGVISVAANPVAASTTPIVDGTATIGVSAAYARADHVHPTDTTRGTVTSVAASVPAPFTITGSPITGAGTLAIGLNAATAAKLFFASPNAAAGAPVMRAIVATDLPVATTAALGVVEAGAGLNVTAGVLSVAAAPPTFTISTVAAGGTANTFMRSDAAPAIDQAMMPTWTQAHAFNGGMTTTSFASTAPAVLSGGYTIGGTLPAPTAALTGARAFVTNSATAGVFGSTLTASTGGTPVLAPVFCDGTVWVYG